MIHVAHDTRLRYLRFLMCKKSDRGGPSRIREGKGHLSIVAIPAPKTKRVYNATAALERKLKESKSSKELDCPPDFFTEPLEE